MNSETLLDKRKLFYSVKESQQHQVLLCEGLVQIHLNSIQKCKISTYPKHSRLKPPTFLTHVSRT